MFGSWRLTRKADRSAFVYGAGAPASHWAASQVGSQCADRRFGGLQQAARTLRHVLIRVTALDSVCSVSRHITERSVRSSLAELREEVAGASVVRFEARIR